MKITHHQLADGSVHGLAIPQYAMIRFRDCAPVPVDLEDGDDMIRIVVRSDKINDERRESMESERCRRKHCAFNTLRLAVAHHEPWRMTRFICADDAKPKSIQKVLDFRWRIQ